MKWRIPKQVIQARQDQLMYEHKLRLLYKGTKLTKPEHAFVIFNEEHRKRLVERFTKMHKRQEELLIYKMLANKGEYQENF